MTYRNRFQVRTPLVRVVESHNHIANMTAITTPPIITQMQRAPVILVEGDEIDFTMWFGPLSVHRLAHIDSVSFKGFTDRQLLGQFAEWVHRHTFVAVDEQTTDVMDEITLRLCFHPIWWPVSMGMRLAVFPSCSFIKNGKQGEYCNDPQSMVCCIGIQ